MDVMDVSLPPGPGGRDRPATVSEQLIAAHLADGRHTLPRPGEELALRVDQTLTQDATGTLVMQELEALGLERVRTGLSVQYVDHNILQADERNAEDHLFLRSAARRFGLWYSKPGNGVSHPTHMQRFGVPGATLIGSDSHTCAGGSLGMLAIGTGGLDVAQAMAGRPLRLRMPRIWAVELTGTLPDWVSAKDVILEMLRRHGVKGGVGRIVEYHGEGLRELTAMDRHVIANMGAELGATATVFPADEAVRDFLRAQGRESDFRPLTAGPGAYEGLELTDRIDLSALEPLVAAPTSPGNVTTVREAAGTPLTQVVIGSSANPGLRDFAIAAAMVRGRQTAPAVSFDVNPTSREILQDMTRAGITFDLIAAGARIHQSGCLGCIGMGQAPAPGQNSLRTFPRNFPGRSGTADDQVWLCSPETAAASALTGQLTDPRAWARAEGVPYPALDLPGRASVNREMLEPPLPPAEAARVELRRGPNISALPELDPLPEQVSGPVLLKVGDDVSTDEISPAGARALPYRSNLPRLADFTLTRIDPDYPRRARDHDGPHLIVAGENYGQGSSREHAAITPRLLGLRAVLAKSYARIHWQNLANFGVLALEFADPADYERISQGDRLCLADARAVLADGAADEGAPADGAAGEDAADGGAEGGAAEGAAGEDAVGSGAMVVRNETRDESYRVIHRLSSRQCAAVLAGGTIPALAAATSA